MREKPFPSHVTTLMGILVLYYYFCINAISFHGAKCAVKELKRCFIKGLVTWLEVGVNNIHPNLYIGRDLEHANRCKLSRTILHLKDSRLKRLLCRASFVVLNNFYFLASFKLGSIQRGARWQLGSNVLDFQLYGGENHFFSRLAGFRKNRQRV